MAEPSVRRMIRVTRLLSELGHTDVIDALDELKLLREALQRAARWGISSAGFDAHTACQLEDWVKGGMRGELPPLAPYLTPNAALTGSDASAACGRSG